MRFQVKALRKDGAVVTQVLDAVSEADALQLAQADGLSVLGMKKEGGLAGIGRSRPFQLLLFSHELQVLLKAGISLVEALETLSEREQKPETRAVINSLIESLKEGKTLSAAMERMPEAFPPIFTAGVRASETSGELGESLRRYIQYQSQVDVLRKKIVGASIYPLLLMFFGGMVLFFLLGYVVPKFSQIYQDHSGNISMASKLMLSWGIFVSEHMKTILASIAGLLVLFITWLKLPATRGQIFSWLRRLPYVGERYQLFQLARLYRTLSMLLRGGIPMVKALDMVGGVLDAEMRRRLRIVRQEVSEGQAPSVALQQHGLATPVSIRLLRVAEQTGSMGEMMESAASFHEDEVARDIDIFTRLFEPILMMVIGLVIGGVVLLMYVPIFELAGAIQ
jgi:general secretion pathway protein F